MLPEGGPGRMIYTVYYNNSKHMFPGMDLPYKADRAQPLTAAGEEILQMIYVDHDLSVDDLPVCGWSIWSKREKDENEKKMLFQYSYLSAENGPGSKTVELLLLCAAALFAMSCVEVAVAATR